MNQWLPEIELDHFHGGTSATLDGVDEGTQQCGGSAQATLVRLSQGQVHSQFLNLGLTPIAMLESEWWL
jgi:hypothetical protein